MRALTLVIVLSLAGLAAWADGLYIELAVRSESADESLRRQVEDILITELREQADLRYLDVSGNGEAAFESDDLWPSDLLVTVVDLVVTRVAGAAVVSAAISARATADMVFEIFSTPPTHFVFVTDELKLPADLRSFVAGLQLVELDNQRLLADRYRSAIEEMYSW